MKTFIDNVCVHLKAGTPVLSVNTDETNRLLVEMKRAAWKTGDGAKIVCGVSQKQEAQLFREIAGHHLKIAGAALNEVCDTYNSTLLCQLLQIIDGKLRAGSEDPEKLEQAMQCVEQRLNSVYSVVEWNVITGFDTNGYGVDELDAALMMTTAEAATTNGFPNNCIFLMRDCHPFFNTEATPRYREVLRNIVEKELLSQPATDSAPGISHHLVFVQPDWTPHRDVQSCVTTVDFALPDEKQLEREIAYIEHSIDDQDKKLCPAELRHELCHVMRGFTQTEAVNALAYCVAEHHEWTDKMIRTVIELQKAAFSKTGVLTLIDFDDLPPVEQIGGFENYFDFVEECMLTYTPEAKAIGMSRSKGALLLGVPGTGKSIVAKATAGKMRLPLIVYDFAAQFGSLVGQTEATQRQTIRQIMAKGPCVLLLDEADKVFAGVVSGYQGDSGVNLRAFGRLLSWMANENQEAFVIMTMNRTIGIPPEMLRAGRLDAVFYTTFPTPRERLDILGIHLRKEGGDPTVIAKKHWDEIVRVTDRYVGAELEQIVKRAVRMAVKERFSELTQFLSARRSDTELEQFKIKLQTPTSEMLLAARKMVTPVVKLDQENIDAIERFCKDTATPVSREEGESKVFKVSRNIKLGPSNN